LKKLTPIEKYVVVTLAVHPYTMGYLEEWINRTDNVQINAPAALRAMKAHGYYEAVRAVAGMLEEVPCGQACADDHQ